MWYLIRSLFLLWLFVLSVVFSMYGDIPKNLGIILMSGLFLCFAISIADMFMRDTL